MCINIALISVPPIVEVTDGIAKAHVGGNVTLKCRSKAFPPTENYWTSGNHEPISSGVFEDDK